MTNEEYKERTEKEQHDQLIAENQVKTMSNKQAKNIKKKIDRDIRGDSKIKNRSQCVKTYNKKY